MIAEKCEKSVNPLDLFDILDTFHHLINPRVYFIVSPGWWYGMDAKTQRRESW